MFTSYIKRYTECVLYKDLIENTENMNDNSNTRTHTRIFKKSVNIISKKLNELVRIYAIYISKKCNILVRIYAIYISKKLGKIS